MYMVNQLANEALGMILWVLKRMRGDQYDGTVKDFSICHVGSDA